MRWVYLLFGHLCVAIGVIGIVVPLLPTTPFLLLGAFFYSKGSRRLHDWLLAHSHLGPPIHQWHNYGVITTRAKIISVVLIVGSMSYPIFFTEMALGAKLAASATGLGVVTFLLTRPSTPEESRRRRDARAKRA